MTCIFKRRGEKEDQQLELEFYRIVNNQHALGYKIFDFKQIEFEILFAGKNHNSTGMQIADMIARPIALQIMRPDQQNRAFEIILKKYYKGFGNKVFP